jgi:hypothetical protein
MAPRKRSAAPANTTVVCRARRIEIDTVLRCAAKPNTPPSTRRHHVLCNDLQGLVWGVDADTPLDRALQNECATRPCVAERHTAARSARWSLTLSAARELAAATTIDLPMVSAKTKARLDTRGVPGPGPLLCAITKARVDTRGMSGPGPSLSSSTCPTLSLRSARLVHTSEFLPGEMGASMFHFKRSYRPRSRRGRSRQELKENRSRGP